MDNPLLEERPPVRIFVTVPGVGMATAYSTLMQLLGETTDGDSHGLGDYTIRISRMNGRILIAMEDDGEALAHDRWKARIAGDLEAAYDWMIRVLARPMIG
jgi:hypothetical protein